MKTSVGKALWRSSVFVAVCLVATFALISVFGQLRFDETKSYQAVFANVSGLENGNFVRIAGVEVGKVSGMTLEPDSTVMVKFSADDSVVLTEGSRAAIRYDNLIGGRYLALEEGTGGTKILQPGATIPIDSTDPALDLDALIGGFRPLFRALNPDQVNALSGQLIRAFQGEGETIGSILSQTAALTNTLADRDQLIGQVVTSLNVVLGSLGNRSEQVAKTIDSLSELINGLAARKEDITAGIAYTSAAAGSIADLLSDARPPFADTLKQADRVASLILADHDYVDNVLATLPDAYRALARQGLYGDFFSYYACDLLLKLNGKGGQPVYVKVAGQSSGRCAPK